MNELARAQMVLRAPRRDWRFWASVAAAALVALACIGFIATWQSERTAVGRARTLQTTLDKTNTVAECRAAAAVFADTASQRADNILTQSFVASFVSQTTDPAVRRSELQPYVEALDIASRDAAVALVERDRAVARCEVEPNYRISEALLQPIPPYPQTAEPGEPRG